MKKKFSPCHFSEKVKKKKVTKGNKKEFTNVLICADVIYARNLLQLMAFEVSFFIDFFFSKHRQKQKKMDWLLLMFIART
jgi:hypothetical protein